MVLEKTPENHLDSKEIKPAKLKVIQPLITHWKDWCWSWNSSTLVIWCKQLTHWKISDSGKDWGQRKKRASEDEVAEWHYWCNGHEFGQFQEMVRGKEAWIIAVHEVTESITTWWLSNNMKDHTESYMTWMKETEDKIKCKNISCSWIGTILYETRKDSEYPNPSWERRLKHHAFWIQTILLSYSKWNSMVLILKQTHARPVEQNRLIRNKPIHLW